jgi:uncharacterized protein (TIGR02145 family)
MKNSFKKYKNICVLTLLIGTSFLYSCEEDTPVTPVPETGTVTDVSGNVYKTVKIGEQWWMAENLKTTQYKNGVNIESLNNAENWLNGTAAYCQFDNNQIAPGLLYNWAAVKSENGLAPEGWHVATEEDWKKLERNLKMSETEINKINWREDNKVGDKLKVKGPGGWTKFESVWGNNESGFEALSGGCRLNNGNWGNPGIGATAFWWSSTENDYNTAWMRQLDYKKSGVFRFYIQKNYGLSVRCVKD